MRPYIPVTIYCKQFTALIDTGSNVILIGNEVKEYLLRHGAFVEKINTRIYMANRNHDPISLKYFFHCTVNNKPEYLRAMYAPFLQIPIVLGIDVIRSLQLVNIIPTQLPSDQMYTSVNVNNTANSVADHRDTFNVYVYF